MKLSKWFQASRKRGIALIVVVGALALTTVLLIAMFSVTESEYRATQSYVAAQSAKQYADMAVSIVQAQIQNAQIDPVSSKWTPDARTTHTTQPGAAIKYLPNGLFSQGFKLYSSSNMIAASLPFLVRGQDNGGRVLVPPDWNTADPINRARFVDLNEPVVRSSLAGTAGTPAVYFPIIDPRAAYNFAPGGVQVPPGWESAYGQKTTKVEGFSYVAGPGAPSPGVNATQSYTGWAAGAAVFNGTVVPAGGVQPHLLRLPMPVEWIYVLRDGTFGTLNVAGRFIKAPGGTDPSPENPMVGRMAFWTDDESCKINVNTASEPTYAGTPFYFHDRDRMWAHYPAATGEYQRYPGHPATVALSAVLYPGHLLDAYHPEPGMSKAQIVTLKNQFYDILPKVDPGGSQAGTVPFVVDELNSYGDSGMASHVDLTTALNERLFASVDEMLFKDGVYATSTGRAASYITAPDGLRVFDHNELERSRFFLTAQSRAPEFSNHGLPRICMWPVSDEQLVQRRTNFDNMIALCATMNNWPGAPTSTTGASSYFFRRLDPHHSTADVTGGGGTVWDGGHIKSRVDNSTTLTRNSKLLSYIEKQLTSLRYPMTGGGASTNYSLKYGTDNVRQLAVEIFDYIRCINLYDGVQARWNNGEYPPGFAQQDPQNPGNFSPRYDRADAIAQSRFTYTNQRNSPSWTGNDDRTNWSQTEQTGESAAAGVLPGHGTVTPAAWKNGGKVYMGFGRFFTLSEIGLHFICTADGATNPKDKPDGSETYPVGPGSSKSGWQPFGIPSGGGSAVRTDQTYNADPEATHYKPQQNSQIGSSLANCNVDSNRTAQWWSNFPPLKGEPNEWVKNGKNILTDYYGCDISKPAGEDNRKHPSLHPGLFPENWNLTLAYNRPLDDETPSGSGVGGEKRVQANIDLETFCPMAGWTKFYPEFTIVLDGDYIAQIKLGSGNKTPRVLFNTGGPIALKSNNNHYELAGQHSIGGHASPAAMFSGRSAGSFGVDGENFETVPIPDPDFDSSPSKPRAGLNNYSLASNFLTVDRDKPMKVTFPKSPMKITIYDSHDWQNRDPVQIIEVSFPDISCPTPNLASPRGMVNNFRVMINTGVSQTYYRSYQGPHWWVYNSLGCIDRMSGKPNGGWKAGGEEPFWQQEPKGVAAGNILQCVRGRLHNQLAVNGFSLEAFRNNGALPSVTGTVTSLPFEITNNTTRRDMDCDVVRTMVPAVGDYRVIAARYEVPSSMWVPHPMWSVQSGKDPLEQFRTIHSYTGQYGNVEPGFKLAVNPNSTYTPGGVPFGLTYNPRLALVSGAYADASGSSEAQQNFQRQPDLPGQDGWASTANSFGDFDTTLSSGREGPFVNKPDEGNYYAGNDTRTISGSNVTKFYRSAYFRENGSSGELQADDWRNGVYMTPNRMVSSPVMFGSLPTGVWNSGGSVPSSYTAISQGSFPSNPGGSTIDASFPALPWQTLLFRPHTYTQPSGTAVGSKPSHPGVLNPMDHYVLDLFFMPVVEPYAISEPLSVAGRLNMNYQILPFTNIRRATGMHALMKGEFMTSVPNQISVSGQNQAGLVALKEQKNQNASGVVNPNLWDTFINETAQITGDSNDGIYVHRPINVEETLAQFDERFRLDPGIFFASQGPFRSASQICELYLIPSMGQGETSSAASSPSALKGLTSASRKDVMDRFWSNNPGTGDNIRERPYSSLYARLTTRSNTFRVHVRAQVIKKARSVEPERFDPDKDAVLSEYRGSTLIERYVDPNDITKPLPDYGSAPDPLVLPPLDTFYKFRAIETKRFNP